MYFDASSKSCQLNEMLQRSEQLLDSSALNNHALFNRRPQILSATLKLLIGTTATTGTDCVTSALQLIEESLQSMEESSDNKIAASTIGNPITVPSSNKEFELSFNRSIENILLVSSSFSAAIDSDSEVMKSIDCRKSDTEQIANRVLEKLDTKDCLKVEKYLQELSLTDSSIGNILTADKSIVETRSNIISFAELHIEKADCVEFLREAAPVV